MLRTSRRAFLQTGAAVAASRVRRTPAPAARNRLSSAFPPGRLAEVLLPRKAWKPFPTDHGAWTCLSEDVRSGLIQAATAHLDEEWPVLPATSFLEYVRTGDRSHYEHLRSARRERLRELVIGECLEGNGRFIDDVLNGIWATCEETFWGVPAHLTLQKARGGLPDVTEPVVDLFAAETGSLLAWTTYLLEPQLAKISQLLPRRIYREVGRRILTPNLQRDDFWWMGFGDRSVNNWNPWINSNWLTCALLLERDDSRRVAAVHKILRSLDRFLDGYPDDGGCDEGPGYWGRAGASLFDCLELLRSASAGAIDFYSMPLVREIGRYIYRVHIYDDYFINFADASAIVHVPADLVFRYGRRIGDEKMQALGCFAFQHHNRTGRIESIGRQLPALFDLEFLRAAAQTQPLLRDAWLSGIQVMAARCNENSAKGLYLAAKGGHNAESHNHNDVGNFIVYADGRPAIIDVGVGTYTAKTFSAHRYDIWTMQSAYHNLPTIDGVMQGAGRQFAAGEVSYRASGAAAEFALNIEHAWPSEAGLAAWHRTLRLERRQNEIEVLDRYVLSKDAARITLTLMTPRKPDGVAGELLLPPDVVVSYDARGLKPIIEEIRIEDGHLKSVWGECLYRVLLTSEQPPLQGTFALRIHQPV